MKEAQAEQQSQSQRQAWHINLCQSAPTTTPNAPTRPRNWHSKKGIPAHAVLGSLSQQLEDSSPLQEGSTDTHLPIQPHFSIHTPQLPRGFCQGCGMALGAGAHVLAGIQPER